MTIIKPPSEILLPVDSLGARLGVAGAVPEGMLALGYFTAELRDADGKLLRREVFPNTVVTVGKNYLLDNGMAGSSYTAAFYMGLISNVSYSAIAAGDTMASHGGWTESVAYSNAARITTAWSAASSGSKALSAALVFNINATDTIKGCFLTTVSTKSGTTGTLFSAGLFTGGDQPVVSGNTLSVSYSLAV
jgi:hypothetical protein